MNHFERCGIDADEFADALAEAMRMGGATPEEIAEARFDVHVDAQLDDGDPGWVLHRTR